MEKTKLIDDQLYHNSIKKELASEIATELTELKDTLVFNYNTAINKNIDFLFDYSEHLIKGKKIDPKIINWQIENSQLLKNYGFDVDKVKEFSRNKIKYHEPENIINSITCKLIFIKYKTG